MIGERLGDGEDHPLRGVGDVGITLRRGVFGNDGRPITRSCVVHEKTAIRCKLRMEGEAQQPLLATANDAARDVQKWRGLCLAGLKNTNPAGLLNNEQAVRSVVRISDENRLVEAGEKGLEGDGGVALKWSGVCNVGD